MLKVKNKFIEMLSNNLIVENNKRTSAHKSLLDVCFMVAAVDQGIQYYFEFMQTVANHSYELGNYIDDSSHGYTHGSIHIYVRKPSAGTTGKSILEQYFHYYYSLHFVEDRRYFGECRCTAAANDFNAEHNCCGKTCDWSAPKFYLQKNYNGGHFSWNGDQQSYWDYQNKFNRYILEKEIEHETYKKEHERKQLEKLLKQIQAQLATL